MIEFLIIWMISILISLGLDKIFTLRVYKYLADLGYRSNTEEIDDLSNEIFYMPTLGTLIPIYNVIMRIYGYIDTISNQNEIFELLRKNDFIKPMTINEKALYRNNPTAFGAMQVLKEAKYNMSRIQSIYMIIDNAENEIFYRMSEDGKKLEIIKVQGPLNRRNMSKEEIEKLIFDCWKDIFKISYKLYGPKMDKKLSEINEFDIENIEGNAMGIEELQFKYNYNELIKMNNYFDKPDESEKFEKQKTLGTKK